MIADKTIGRGPYFWWGFALMAINADQRVMEFMLGTMTEEETRQSIDNAKKHFDAHGFGRWAVEIADSEKFIGFVGISVPPYSLPFSPCVEAAWRICAEEWGKGYAPEAANEAMRDGFERVGLQEIVSFTTLTNLKSRPVMEKLGMKYCPAEDFHHPMVAEGHRLRRHVLYRMGKADWKPQS